MNEKQEIMKAFFSWQSDLPQEATTRIIRECLRWASSELEGNYSEKNLRLDLEEATRNLPGSPNVLESIVKKIEAADIFVCDITTINAVRPPETRPVPNPNVLFELGFAVAHLGWDRIILLFNETYGDFDKDVPFDLKGQRISKYKCELPIPEQDALTKREKGEAREKMVQPLRAILLEALAAIVTKQPLRPADLKELSLDELKRRRDSKMLTEVLSTFSLSMMDFFVESLLTRQMPQEIFGFWEGFKALTGSSSYHVNDPQALAQVQNLYVAWESCFQFANYFVQREDGSFLFKLEPGDAPLPQTKANALREMEQCALRTREALQDLLSHVRSDYPEIDLDRTSELAWIRQQELEEDFRSRVEAGCQLSAES